MQEVGDWLESQGLSQYKEKFSANEISGAVLVRLDKDSLPELVPNAGDQVHLLRAIDELRGDLDDLRASLFGTSASVNSLLSRTNRSLSRVPKLTGTLRC